MHDAQVHVRVQGASDRPALDAPRHRHVLHHGVRPLGVLSVGVRLLGAELQDLVEALLEDLVEGVVHGGGVLLLELALVGVHSEKPVALLLAAAQGLAVLAQVVVVQSRAVRRDDLLAPPPEPGLPLAGALVVGGHLEALRGVRADADRHRRRHSVLEVRLLRLVARAHPRIGRPELQLQARLGEGEPRPRHGAALAPLLEPQKKA